MATSEAGSDSAVTAIDPWVFERRWKILAVLCTSLMVVIVGNTALNVALPTLARELGASTSAQQWMVDGYGLVFAGLLLTAGTIGDRYGRKGALQIGLLVFLVGSLSAANLNSASGVIVGRAVMGFGAAFVMPATLSILTNVFPPEERGKAIAIWAGVKQLPFAAVMMVLAPNSPRFAAKHGANRVVAFGLMCVATACSCSPSRASTPRTERCCQ